MRQIVFDGDIGSAQSQLNIIDNELCRLVGVLNEHAHVINRIADRESKTSQVVSALSNDVVACREAVLVNIDDICKNSALGEHLLKEISLIHEKINKIEQENKILKGIACSISKACANSFERINKNQQIKIEDIAKLEKAFDKLSIK